MSSPVMSPPPEERESGPDGASQQDPIISFQTRGQRVAEGVRAVFRYVVDGERASSTGVENTSRHEITRFAFLRALGAIHFVAFVSLALQLEGLLGSRGLTPVVADLERFEKAYEHGLPLMIERPTLFWMSASDGALWVVCALGIAVSLAVMLGVTNAVVMGVLWLLYLSFVNVGQIWFAFGWELLLLETTFLAIFWCPLQEWRPFPKRSPPSRAVTLLLRWLLFRLMLGAGLIKLRGDVCWTELTCLELHFLTQPVPGPLSPFFHELPSGVLAGGVVFNHVVELVAPWLLFVPWRRVRHAAAVSMVLFQVFLILSGNLAFLNGLTLVIAIAAFDDRALLWITPRFLRERLLEVSERREVEPRLRRQIGVGVLVVGVGLLSIEPVRNMISPNQAMNASFFPVHIVNTYGAFGSVRKWRFEIIIEGTQDDVITEHTEWKPYGFHCKPGDVDSMPCWITPHHLRLDWLMWFAPYGRLGQHPWLVHLVAKLLDAEPAVLGLLEHDPFGGERPTFIRMELYEYRFATDGSSWWVRERTGVLLPPVSQGDPRIESFLKKRGWR